MSKCTATQFVEALLTEKPEAIDGNTMFFQPPAVTSEEWERQQQESIERYQDESYEADATIGELFGGFIGATLRDRDSPVLDIGCGLHPLCPHYVKQLACRNLSASSRWWSRRAGITRVWPA